MWLSQQRLFSIIKKRCSTTSSCRKQAFLRCLLYPQINYTAATEENTFLQCFLVCKAQEHLEPSFVFAPSSVYLSVYDENICKATIYVLLGYCLRELKKIREISLLPTRVCWPSIPSRPAPRMHSWNTGHPWGLDTPTCERSVLVTHIPTEGQPPFCFQKCQMLAQLCMPS